MLEAGADPNLCLLSARNTSILKMLIDAGADVNNHDKHGVTALMLRAEEGQLDNVKLFFRLEQNQTTPVTCLETSTDVLRPAEKRL